METKERTATWEYMTVSLNAETNWQTGIGVKKPELADEEIQNRLNRWGAEGWECFALVADELRGGPTDYIVTTYRAMFKRLVP